MKNWKFLTDSTSSSSSYYFPEEIKRTDIILRIKKDDKAFEHLCDEINKTVRELMYQGEAIASANNALSSEIRNNLRYLDPHDNTEAVESEISKMHLASDNQFIQVAFKITMSLATLAQGYKSLAKGLDPNRIYIPKEGLDSLGDSIDDMVKMQTLMAINKDPVSKFSSSILGIPNSKMFLIDSAYEIISSLDSYYKALTKRHSTDGIQIHVDPIVTDVALSIYENIDSSGDLEAIDDPNTVSAYSKRKAQIMARALEDEPLRSYLVRIGSFTDKIVDHIRKFWNWSEKLDRIFSKHYEKAIQFWEPPLGRIPGTKELDTVVAHIKDLDPSLVKYKDRAVLMNHEERFHNQYTNETLEDLASMIRQGVRGEKPFGSDLINYVLKRKSQLAKHNESENTFYICKIGEGNRFKQIPPGMLTISPGERPKVNLDEIWGEGFDEIRDHVETIELSSKWHDLFVATSPSRSADKSNVLMIGPQGCGKSEVMRAIGADGDSISVFAQGSDFLTCWLGEAEKNPKRLFQAAARLQKERQKHVFILIDEADSVMKKQELKGHSEVDLTMEFQICMDGVISYPKLTVIAATNNPSHMPMTILRRFSKVMIVGELNDKNRKEILRHYVNFMPTKGFTDGDWNQASSRLDGATGDVIRKVVDSVWRSKISWFIKNQSEQADKMLKWLNDGQQFNISKFDKQKRYEFHKLLGPYVHIEPKDIKKSIDTHLKNVGIQGEIRTARSVYQEAHELLDSLDSSGLILSS